MTLYAPSYAGGFASPERGLIDRPIWDGTVGAWCPSLGATGLTLRDHSGKANHGTLTNMTLADAWANPAGLAFDGTNDDVLFPAMPEPSTFAGLGLVAWIYRTASADWDSIIDCGLSFGSASEGTINFGVRNSDVFRFRVSDGGNLSGIETGADTIPSGQWVHVAATWTGDTSSGGMKLYIDGKLSESASATFLISTLRTGDTWSLSGTRLFFDGVKDDIHVYNRDLTANEVAELYRLGPGGIYRRQLQYNVKAPAAATGRINSLVGVGGGMIGYGGGMIGRGY